MLVLAIALPVTTNLVKKSQENRSKATTEPKSRYENVSDEDKKYYESLIGMFYGTDGKKIETWQEATYVYDQTVLYSSLEALRSDYAPKTTTETNNKTSETTTETKTTSGASVTNNNGGNETAVGEKYEYYSITQGKCVETAKTYTNDRECIADLNLAASKGVTTGEFCYEKDTSDCFQFYDMDPYTAGKIADSNVDYSGACPSAVGCSSRSEGKCKGSPYDRGVEQKRSEADCICADSEVKGCSKYYLIINGVGETSNHYHVSAEACTTFDRGTCYSEETYRGMMEAAYAAQQAAIICNAGTQKQCSGTQPQICNSAGTAWDSNGTDCGSLGCTDGVCNQPVCTAGAVECVGTSQIRTCTNNTWVTSNCNSVQVCSDGECKAKSTANTEVHLKMAFAGVKPNNDKCVTNLWPVTMSMSMSVSSDGVNVSSNALELVKGVPIKTDSTNSKGDIIYTYKVAFSDVPSSGYSGLSFFLKGPKHISLKYGEDKQKGYYLSSLGKLALNPNVITNYDFSEFPMATGDVTGDIVGTPDGKIDSRDWSYVKGKTQPITVGAEGADLAGDVDGNCRVNSIDADLVKKALKEINGQTY